MKLSNCSNVTLPRVKFSPDTTKRAFVVLEVQVVYEIKYVRVFGIFHDHKKWLPAFTANSSSCLISEYHKCTSFY